MVGTGLAILIGACAGPKTTIEESWVDPAAQASGPSLRKVVALVESQDGALRRTGEDEMVRQLQARGLAAAPAYQVLSGNELQDPESAKARLRAAGYDGVVKMKLVGKETEVEITPDAYGPWWGAPYGYGYGGADVYTQEVVRIETNAYSLQQNRLVWSGLSKTVDPKNASEVIDDVAKAVVKELDEEGIA